MSNKNLGHTQQLVLNYLRAQASTAGQRTNEEVANDLCITKDQAKHALAKLTVAGLALRTDGRPARWFAAPQVVTNPPLPHAQPLHGSMPSA